MAKPYSMDLRERVVAAIEAGETRPSVARRFQISLSSIGRYIRRQRNTGSVAPDKFGGYRPCVLAAYEDTLRVWIAEKPDLRLVDIQERMACTYGIKVGLSTISTFLRKKLGLSYKKTLHAAEQERADIQEARKIWIEALATFDLKKLVFVDETWATTNMTPLRGRGPRGEKLVCKAPSGHWKTTTFVAAMRHDSVTAPLVLDGAINGLAFRAWVEQFLVPTLSPGDCVIMDNLSSHKVAGIREAIEDTGARLLYLPPYSPDLNPIEMMFAKLKTLLRRAAERTVDALWNTIGNLLSQITPDDCRAFIQHIGYGQPKMKCL